jgi:hypothetical protein
MIPARPKGPPLPPTPVSRAKVLFVEGDTPMHFFEALLRHLGLDSQIEILNFRGIGDFKTFLLGQANSAEFQRLVTSVGIVRDAEEKPAAIARQSVEDALTAAGLTPQRNPPIQTSIFILPDNTNPGMLETLCMEAVKNESTLAGAYRCIEDFFACLTRNQIALPASPMLAKHHAQAYLATRPQAQMFPGLAAYRGYWPWTSATFQPLIQFLQAI